MELEAQETHLQHSHIRDPETTSMLPAQLIEESAKEPDASARKIVFHSLPSKPLTTSQENEK